MLDGYTMTVIIKDDIRKIVIEYLEQLEIYHTLKGEKILVSAIEKVYKNPEKYVDKITVLLYPELADEFSIRSKCVERNMRTALEKAWTKGNSDLHYGLYGPTISKRTGNPTVAKFIWLTVEILKQRLN